MRLARLRASALGLLAMDFAADHFHFGGSGAGSDVVEIERAGSIEAAQGGYAVSDAAEQDGEFRAGGKDSLMLQFGRTQKFDLNAGRRVGLRIEIELHRHQT